MTGQPTGTVAQAGRDVVMRFIRAIEERNSEALPAMLTEDVVQVTAFSPQGGVEPFERYAGRDAVVGHFADVFRIFAAIKLECTGLFVSEDGSIVFVEALGNATMADTGITYRNRYVFKFGLRDSRVAGLTEYFNAVTFAQLIGNHSDDDHPKFEEAC